MKFSRVIFPLFLICAIGINLAYSQDNSKKDKSNDKNSSSKSVEVKANLMVLNADGKFADDVNLEDLKIFEDGTEQKITYFARKENALNIGLVIDNSGSLRDIFKEVIFAASTIAANLKQEDEAFLVRFTSSDKINILQEWTRDKGKLNSQIQNMYVEGGRTAMIDAIYLSAQKMLEREKQAKSERYALILITDGVEADSYYSRNELLKLFRDTDLQIFSFFFPGEKALKEARRARRDSIIINTPNEPTLLNNILSLKTGGTAYTLPPNFTKETIVDTVRKILSELRSQYVIGYTSTNQKRDNQPRSLRVEIVNNQKGEKRQGIVRENFVVPRN